jgi:translocator protein
MLSIVDSSLFLWLSLCYLALAVGAVSMALMHQWREWYAHLKKAPWSPPSWVFGIVWPVLYTLRGVASWLTFRALSSAPSYSAWVICWVFALVTLFLQAAWTPIFFGLNMIRLALLILVLTFASALIQAGTSWSISLVAGALLVPELLWLGFAFSLNLYAVMSNDVSDTTLEEETFERL